MLNYACNYCRINIVRCHGVAQDLQTPLKMTAKNRGLGMSFFDRPAGVGNRPTQKVRGEFVFAVDQMLFVFANKHEADHDVIEHALIKINDDGAQPVGAD